MSTKIGAVRESPANTAVAADTARCSYWDPQKSSGPFAFYL